MSVSAEIIKSSKLLIVDDNASNLMLLEAMLEQEDYTNVRSTMNPIEVCELDAIDNYDLILLDIQMPEMDGFEVMEKLHANHDGSDYLPVLVLTAQTDMQTRLRALDLGARDFITKPFQHAEVLQRIKNSLEIRHLYIQQKDYSLNLEQRVKAATKENVEIQLDVIRCLGRAGEYRDNETGDHVIRMSKSCQLLALEYGLTAKDAELILHASPMHDVGKIAIPDHILMKPGKFTNEEWEIMKTHAQLGADILSHNRSEIIRLARTIALTHHEKWDGSGYPSGISGDSIPIAGRIAAICDVFDALTSERPYKKAWSVNEAMTYIHDQSGIHFDPELVELFQKILPNVLIIKDHNNDHDLKIG